LQIELTCDSCGSNRFVFPDGGDEGSRVFCEECGHPLGTMGALKAAVAQAAIEKKPVPKVRKTSGIDHVR